MDMELGESRSVEKDRKGRDGDAPARDRKVAALLCGAVALAAALATAWQLVGFYGEEARSEQKMEELRKVSLQDAPGPEGQGDVDDAAPGPEEGEPGGGGAGEAAPAEGEAGGAAPAEGEPPVEENPYSGLFAQNGDMAAWLAVEGTGIDYPVMQTMEDENYYLERDFQGDADKAGCLILDTDSDLHGAGTTNLIVHGHNMKSGAMFGELDLYADEGYCAEHRHMELYLETEKREYEVIAAFYSQVYYADEAVFKYYDFFQADSPEGFGYFYDNIREMSLYDTGVTAQPGDSFLTLSTCAYHVEDGRFVVVAKETGRQELRPKEDD